MTSVLMVLTGADVWTMKNGTPHPTGFWSEEFTAPHQAFTGAGLDISVATPRGRAPAVDPLSLDLRFNTDQADVDSQQAYLASLKPQLDKPLALGDVNPADYDVMFVVGGPGPMQDLAVDPDIGGLIGRSSVIRARSSPRCAMVRRASCRLTTPTATGCSRGAGSPASATRRKISRASPGTRRGCSRIAFVLPGPCIRPKLRGLLPP